MKKDKIIKNTEKKTDWKAVICIFGEVILDFFRRPKEQQQPITRQQKPEIKVKPLMKRVRVGRGNGGDETFFSRKKRTHKRRK